MSRALKDGQGAACGGEFQMQCGVGASMMEAWGGGGGGGRKKRRGRRRRKRATGVEAQGSGEGGWVLGEGFSSLRLLGRAMTRPGLSSRS